MTGTDRPAIWLLAVGQTLIYAGCYYSFPALLPDLEAATGWSKAALALGPTLGFLIMAALIPFTGRLVDRGWGGELLSVMPGLAALGVGLLGLVDSLGGWLVAWALIGVAQAGCLYETCFAFLTRRLGEGARAAITRVTLVAGFAGTLAFPLGHWLGDSLGGSRAMIAFAGLMVLVIPLNAVAVRRVISARTDGGIQPSMITASSSINVEALRMALARPSAAHSIQAERIASLTCQLSGFSHKLAEGSPAASIAAASTDIDATSSNRRMRPSGPGTGKGPTPAALPVRPV